MSWSDASPWLGLAGAALGLLVGLRWALWPERVVARPNSGATDPVTVRRFGLVMIAICALVLPLMLLDLLWGRP